MKINTTKEILKLDGTSFSDKPTIGEVLSNTLAYDTQSSNPYLATKLAKKIATEDEVDLTAEEIVFLKESISKPGKNIALIVGTILEELEK